jgi:hypothetical protein
MHQVGYADPSEKGGFSSGVRLLGYMLFQMLLGDLRTTVSYSTVSYSTAL